MNILYIAFSCSPTNGSEDSVGWNIPLASSKYNKVYVLTKESAKNVIDNYMKEHNDIDMKFFYVDNPDIYKKLFKGFLFSGRLNLFHKSALPLTAKICEEYDIDVIHQITPVEFRAIGNYGQIPNVKFVCGPVWGGEYVPKGLWTYTKGHRIVEVLRMVMNSYYRLKYNMNGRLKNCDAVVYANKETHDYLGVDGKIITEVAVPNNVDKSVDKVKNGKCVFLVAGRMIYRKGHRFLLDAMRSIPIENDYEVRIVGAGSELASLQKIVKKDANLTNHTVFVPKIPYTEMKKEYENADVFIMPSIRETTGSVLLEAMGYGLPVIAIDKFGSGLILNRDIGWTYNGTTREEYITSLAKAMEYCITHPEEVERRSKNMLNEAHRYTWEKKVTTFNDIYKEVLSK